MFKSRICVTWSFIVIMSRCEYTIFNIYLLFYYYNKRYYLINTLIYAYKKYIYIYKILNILSK